MFYLSLGNTELNLYFWRFPKIPYSFVRVVSVTKLAAWLYGELFCGDSFSLGTFFVLVEEGALLILAIVIWEFLLHSITYFFSELLNVQAWLIWGSKLHMYSAHASISSAEKALLTFSWFSLPCSWHHWRSYEVLELQLVQLTGCFTVP